MPNHEHLKKTVNNTLWLRQRRGKMTMRSSLVLLLAGVLAGCGGGDEGGDEPSPMPPPPVGRVSVVDGFGAVRPNTATRVDLSAFVRGQGATLTALRSEQTECAAARLSGLTAEVTIDDGGLCRYAFTASNGASDASAALNVLASSKVAPVLPPLSQAMMLGGGSTTFDLQTLLGTDWPSGYSLDVNSLQVQGGSVQGSAAASGNSIIYTPPATPDWNRIVFILKHPDRPNEDALGTLYITVSDSINQAPVIDKPKYDYHAETGLTVNAFDPITLDLATLPTLGISDPEGRDWQLVEVQSYAATVSPLAPDSVTNKQFTFTAGALGAHIVSYIVGDHQGGFTMGQINIVVGPKERLKDWADITVDDLTFYATPLHSEASRQGVIAEGIWDSGVNLADTLPGNTIAGVTGAGASAYCNGKRLATPANLDRLRTTAGVDAARVKYPAQRDYLVSNDGGASYLAYNLENGDTTAYTPGTSPNGYVICVTSANDGKMSYVPIPNSPITGYLNTAISDGATWWPLGQVTSDGGVSGVALTASNDAGSDVLSAANIRLAPAGCAGGRCTLEANANPAQYGTAAVRLTSDNSNSLDINPVTFWQNAKLTALRTGVDGSAPDGVTQNTVIATLQDHIGAPLANTEVKLSYSTTPSANVTVTPPLQPGGTPFTTDANGEVTLGLANSASGPVIVNMEPVVAGIPGSARMVASTFANSGMYIQNFTTPDLIRRNWQDADAYCKGLTPSARLPAIIELQNLFLQSTSATEVGQINFDMCEVHGWPLADRRCGGLSNEYWSSEKDGQYTHLMVPMNLGISLGGDNSTVRQVTCVR